jgi:hypothetical protein
MGPAAGVTLYIRMRVYTKKLADEKETLYMNTFMDSHPAGGERSVATDCCGEMQLAE